MMSGDVIISDSIYQDNAGEKYESMRDPRFERDMQADLHTAIDLAFEFAKIIKGLHPLAEKQIKEMIMRGNLL